MVRICEVVIVVGACVWVACASKEAAVPAVPADEPAAQTAKDAATPGAPVATPAPSVPAFDTTRRAVSDQDLPVWPPSASEEALPSGDAADAARPGRIVEERPTLKCLGVRWYVAGDANRNARIELRYRMAGTGGASWTRGLDLFRTGPGWPAHTKPAEGESLYAGSAFYLDEDTEYQVKLTLVDPDGGGTEKVLRMKTRAEPKLAVPRRTLHVAPGDGGGSGTKGDPFRGLVAADAAASPGDLFLVHAGTYPAPWTITKSGRPDAPIVWCGAGDGEAAIDGAHHETPPGRGVSMSGVRDVWLEGLSIRDVVWAIVNHEGQRTVIRRCRTYRTTYGFTATRHTSTKRCLDILIADCDMRGPSTWPRSKGIENARGIQITGLGHVICHNFIRGFADAIDTFKSRECSAVDIYRNEMEVLTDDGIECDYSCHNVRCFENRLTNVFQGISTQPTYGGPIYIFRNALFNIGLEPFKMHNGPSGSLMFHNTCVKTNVPSVLYSSKPVTNFVTRNNIFLGGPGEDGGPPKYGFEITCKMVRCDFDYDGFGGLWKTFLKWNGTRYENFEDLRDGPVYRHAVALDPTKVFAKGDIRPKSVRTYHPIADNDLRLSPGTAAIDAGVRLFGINDDFAGRAPDLGAYELGQTVPHYGPR